MAGFAVIGVDDAYLSSVGTFLDVFTLVRRQVATLYSARESRGMETPIRLLAAEGRTVRLAGGRTLEADAGLDKSQHYELVHLAGFVVGDADSLDARLRAAGPLYKWLQRQHTEGAVIAASGAAIFLLAEAGLLARGPAAVPRLLTPQFRRRYPRIAVDNQRPVIELGRVLTGSGLAADPLLLMRLVELCTSPAMARWVSEVSGLQRVFEQELAEDPLVANAQVWIEERFAQEVRIAELARAMAVSQQTLIRHFRSRLDTTPRDYLQRVRIEAAQIMLRRTRRRIEQIASQVGYNDVRSFRAAFREHSGMSASRYRDSGPRRPAEPVRRPPAHAGEH